MMFCIVAYSNKSYLTRPTYYFKYLYGPFAIACYVKRRVQFYKQPMKLLNTIKTTDQSTRPISKANTIEQATFKTIERYK